MKIEPLNTRLEVFNLRQKGLPRFAHLEEFLSVITDIQDKKINEIIEVLNKLQENK